MSDTFQITLPRETWEIVKKVLEYDAIYVDFNEEEGGYTDACWAVVDAINEARKIWRQSS